VTLRLAARRLAVLGLAMALVGLAPDAAAAAWGTTVGAARSQSPVVDGEACSSADGITVVVDLHELGDGTTFVRCAEGAPATGLEALRLAGIDHQTTVRFPGFICRIGGRPADDPCLDAAPADAYWSYWLAARGGSWCYADRGAGGRTPPPGTVEGWSFALDRGPDGAPPRIEPPPALPGTTPSALPRADCTAGVVGPVPGGEPEPVEPAGSDEVAIDASPAGGGVPWPAVVGGALLLAVAAGAVAATRRRG
jgi:hypothetical protein